MTQVRIITLGRTDIGWLQCCVKDHALFLAQLFVEGGLRRQGIATVVVKGLIEEAGRARRAVTLGVVKTNPALRLYERLGVSHNARGRAQVLHAARLASAAVSDVPTFLKRSHRQRRCGMVER